MTEETTNPTTEQAAPEAPAQTSEPSAQAPAEPVKGEQPQQDSPWSDPEAARAEIERLRKENAKDRTTAKETAANEARNELAQTIGKALGLIQEDTPVDPAELTTQVAQSQAAARQAQIELAVYRNAGEADPAALLDSRMFLDKVKDLNPGDTAALSAAIAEAVQANPRLSAQGAGRPQMKPNPAQGASASEPLSLAEQAAQAAKSGDPRQAMLLKARMALQTNPGL